MNPSRLQSIADAATPGQWAKVYWPVPMEHYWIGVHDEDEFSSRMAGQITEVIPKEGDADLIVLAPELVRALIDLIGYAENMPGYHQHPLTEKARSL